MIYRELIKSIVILFFFSSCKGQVNNECVSSYKNAENLVGEYLNSYNKLLLLRAEKSLDSSIKCTDTKLRTVNLKITVHSLLKDYKGGAVFVDSLSIADFSRPYERKLYSGIFKASQLELLGDTIKTKSLYTDIASDIKQFIKNTSADSLDKKAYANLIFVQSKFLSVYEIFKELDTLKVKFPSDSSYIDNILKQSIAPTDDFNKK